MSKKRPNLKETHKKSIHSYMVTDQQDSKPTLPNVEEHPRATFEINLKKKCIIRIAFFVFLFCFWSFRYYDFLYMAQEYDLFAWCFTDLVEASTRIAGISRYLASFVVQFFYYPILGASIMASFATLTQYLAEKVFNLSEKGFVLSFVPAVLPLLAITNINYFLFERVDVAYIFSFTFNFCFTLVCAYLFGKIATPVGRTKFLLLILLLTFPIFGFFTLLAGYLCVVEEMFHVHIKEAQESVSSFTSNIKTIKTSKQRHRERCELFALFVLLTPCAYWLVYSSTTPTFYYCYTAGLWEESTLTLGRELVKSNFILPFLLLIQNKGLSQDNNTNSIVYLVIALEILFFVLIPLATSAFTKRLKRITPKAHLYTFKTLKALNVISIVFLVLIAACVYFFSFSSPNYRALLRFARNLDNENWEKILADEAKIPDPINPLITGRILALQYTGKFTEEVFLRPLVPKASNSLRSITSFSMCGDRILYLSGHTNLAERTAINNYVTKRDRSIWALKTLILCAVASDRPDLAQRYLYRLQRTLFHKKLANELASYLDYHEQKLQTNNRFNKYLEHRKISQECKEKWDAHFAKIHTLQPTNDDLAATVTVNHALFRVAQAEEMQGHTLEECETILATLLLSRNFPRFCEAFDEYVKMKGDRPLPRALEEGVLCRQQFPQIFSRGKEKSWTPPVNAQPSKESTARFQNFMAMIKVHEPDEVINAKLTIMHGDTFWFFFGKSTNIQYY